MTVYAKVAKVSGLLVGKLKADKTHQQGYAYLSADLILQEAGQAMADNGIVIVPSVVDESVETVEYINQYNKAQTRFDASVRFEMVVSDGGEIAINAKWAGRGSDYTSPDKAVYKAITSGHKYFVMKLFSIGVGNTDSEHDTPADDYPAGKPLKSVPNKSKQKPVVSEPLFDDEPEPDTRGAMTPQAQAERDPRNKPAKPESIFRVGDEIILHGKSDEKPGKVTAVNGDMVTVLVDGNEYTVKADKLSLVEIVQS